MHEKDFERIEDQLNRLNYDAHEFTDEGRQLTIQIIIAKLLLELVKKS